MYIDLVTIDLCPGQGGGGGVDPSGTLEISGNGVYDVYSYASASVSVHPSTSLSETYTSNGAYNISGEFNGGLITVEVPSPQFITETLSVSSNGTYIPSVGVDGFSEVVVDVPQSVTGFTEKEITEGIQIVNLSNSASYVHPYVFEKDIYLQTVYLPNCTNVGEQAFALCQNLSSVYLPNVETIGENAFASCTGLTTVMLNAKKVGGFSGCINLQEVTLPNTETITIRGFYSCVKLSSIYAPNCTSVEAYAFNGCRSLSYVDLPKLTYLNTDTFAYTGLISFSMPRLREIIGNTTFQHCDSLDSVYLPKLRIFSAQWTFNDCRSLSILDIPAVLYNGSNLVERDSNLKELYINSETYVTPTYLLSTTNTGITSIYTNINNVSRFMAAPGWSSHSDKIIGVGDPSVFMLSYSDGVVNGMTKCIGQTYYSYLGMSSDGVRANVVSVDLPNCDYINASTFQNHSNLTNVSLPNCEYIGTYGFASCKYLQDINIPNVEGIYNYTFNNCSSLISVSLSKCKHIYGYAFNGCGNLSSLYLPICEQIDGYAFQGAGLITLTLGSNKVVSASGTALNNLLSLSSIYVPSSLLDAYKSATGFSQFSSKIFPIE